jgi:hypothetical protein
MSPREKLIKPIPPMPDHDPRMLITREQGRQFLGGISESTARRLEQAGTLDPIRLTDSPRGKVFYRRDQILAVAYGRRRS